MEKIIHRDVGKVVKREKKRETERERKEKRVAKEKQEANKRLWFWFPRVASKRRRKREDDESGLVMRRMPVNPQTYASR